MAPSLAPMGWSHGDVIMWQYRREVIPVRVVRDDEWLAVWVAPGTPLLTCVPTDGKDLRDRPVEDRFICPRVFAVREWFGAGTLRLVRPGDAHSSWLFRRPDHETFWGWYGNLEDPLERFDWGVRTVDHLLDVWLDAEGNVGWKDEDEFDAAIRVGRFPLAKAAEIRAEGERVFGAMTRRDPPYDGSWLDWRPDPSWTLPSLPEEYAAKAGTPADEVAIL